MFMQIELSKDWKNVAPISKGWSSDKKYLVETADGKLQLLRISDIEAYEAKKKEYEIITKYSQLGINMSMPIEYGQWLKSITFKLPIIPHDMEMSLDKGDQVETVVLLSKGVVDKDNFRKVKVDFSLEDMDLTELRGKATYAQVKEYILNEFGLKVSSLYIAQVKKKCGLEVGENYNLPKAEDAKQPQVTPEKEEAIMKAFKHFGVI